MLSCEIPHSTSQTWASGRRFWIDQISSTQSGPRAKKSRTPRPSANSAATAAVRRARTEKRARASRPRRARRSSAPPVHRWRRELALQRNSRQGVAPAGRIWPRSPFPAVNPSRGGLFRARENVTASPLADGRGRAKERQGSAARCDPMIIHGFRLHTVSADFCGTGRMAVDRPEDPGSDLRVCSGFVLSETAGARVFPRGGRRLILKVPHCGTSGPA